MARKLPTALQLLGKYIFDMGKNLRATMDAVEKVRKERKEKKA